MTISEKTARQVTKYVIKLVRRQPPWVRALFDEDKITFAMEDDGSVVLYVDKNLDERVKNHARILIEKYLKQNPLEALRIVDIH